jgi:hypothetical protein
MSNNFLFSDDENPKKDVAMIPLSSALTTPRGRPDGAVLAAQLGTPRGRYDEHNNKFPSVMKPRFIKPIGERTNF